MMDIFPKTEMGLVLKQGPHQTAERRKCSLQTQQSKHLFHFSLGPNQSLQLTQFFCFLFFRS